MKILHVTPSYHPAMGGAETQMKEISERLAVRGHAVTVLTLKAEEAVDVSGRPGIKDSELIGDVTVNRFMSAARLHNCFNRGLTLRGAHRFLGLTVGAGTVQMLATGPFSVRPFLDALRSKPDVVTVSNWYCGGLAYQLVQARRLQAFALVGIPLFHTEREWSRSSLYPSMLDRCDAVIAMTEHERRFIGQRSARPNVHVVGVGVDPSAFAGAAGDRVRSRYGLGAAPLVGYVGRMTSAKGAGVAIEAMKQVWRANPAARLILAGAGLSTNPDDEIVRALAGLSDVERSRVTAVGRFDDEEKAAIFAALDLFVMPSVAESFGIAYLEAWMCKKAVIGARIGSSECVIEDGVDGVLVAPGNPEALGDAILRLLADQASREQMGLMGHAKVMNRFTWDKIVDRIESIYTEAHGAAVLPR